MICHWWFNAKQVSSRLSAFEWPMPCNFISSCFFLDAPWHRDPDCLPGAEDAPPVPADHWPLQELDIHQQPVVHQQPGAGVPEGEVATGSAAVNGGAASTENGAAPPKDGVTKVSNVPRAAKTFRAYLPSCHRTYSCVHCRAHLANHDELISKSFQGSQGRAYLFNSVVNIGCGQAEERVLLTGLWIHFKDSLPRPVLNCRQRDLFLKCYWTFSIQHHIHDLTCISRATLNILTVYDRIKLDGYKILSFSIVSQKNYYVLSISHHRFGILFSSYNWFESCCSCWIS